VRRKSSERFEHVRFKKGGGGLRNRGFLRKRRSRIRAGKKTKEGKISSRLTVLEGWTKSCGERNKTSIDSPPPNGNEGRRIYGGGLKKLHRKSRGGYGKKREDKAVT